MHIATFSVLCTLALAIVISERAVRGAFSEQRDETACVVPDGFDWQTYLLYHPDIRDIGIVDEPRAREHYCTVGQEKKLLYKRLDVTMRYTACTGLINQLYSHIAAISLGAMIGANIILPPAAVRDSFAHYFSVFKDRNEVVWTAAPLESLIDVDYLISFWHSQGINISRAESLEPFPDLTQPEIAFVPYPASGYDPQLTVQLPDLYLRILDMEDLVELARQAVVSKAEEVARSSSSGIVGPVVLDLPCTFFMLRSLSNLRLAATVADSLHWSPQIAALADTILRGMKANGHAKYNAVHFRIEKDAKDWALIMGGTEVIWQLYIDAMRQAHFESSTGLYVASGLLTYGDSAEMDHLVETMRQEGLCSSVHYKEMYINREAMEGLNSEQKALLDFVVLSSGDSFVGFGSSTFSFYLQEFRSLRGIHKAKSVLVDSSIIGTDGLFSEAGRIV